MMLSKLDRELFEILKFWIFHDVLRCIHLDSQSSKLNFQISHMDSPKDGNMHPTTMSAQAQLTFHKNDSWVQAR